jgi:outer membrane protein assembly factor BamB
MSWTRGILCLLSLVAFSCHRANRPPYPPQTPTGPLEGKTQARYQFFASTTDPDGDPVCYEFDWGDGDTSAWSRFMSSGLTSVDTNSWSRNGQYSIRARGKDTHEATSEWSEGFVFSIGNRPPTTPQFLYAPGRLWPGMTDSIVVLSYDFDLDSFNYVIDWGDSSGLDTSSLTFSGGMSTLRHTWVEVGSFSVRARARDTRDLLSDWSEPQEVQVPGPRLRWRVFVGSTPSAPAIDPDGTIYVTAGGRLWAVNPDSTIRWAFGSQLDANPVSVDSKNNAYLQPNRSELTVVDVSGVEAWTRRFDRNANSYQMRLSALGLNGICYSSADALYAFDASGVLLWRNRFGTFTSPPALGADGTIYLQSDSDDLVYALNADGTVRWAAPFPSASRKCPPAIGAGGVVFCRGRGGVLAAFDTEGRQMWQLNLDEPAKTNPPAIGPDGVVYCGGDDGLSAIGTDGTLTWLFPTRLDATTTPAILADGTIVFGSDDYAVYGLNPDGTIRWGRGTGGRVRSSPSVAPDGTILFCSDDGYLYALAGTSPLADSPWPMFHHDPQHTGRAR